MYFWFVLFGKTSKALRLRYSLETTWQVMALRSQACTSCWICWPMGFKLTVEWRLVAKHMIKSILGKSVHLPYPLRVAVFVALNKGSNPIWSYTKLTFLQERKQNPSNRADSPFSTTRTIVHYRWGNSLICSYNHLTVICNSTNALHAKDYYM